MPDRFRPILTMFLAFTLAPLASAPVLAHEDVSHSAGYEDESDLGFEEGDIEFTLGANGRNDNQFDSGGFSLATSGGYFFNEHVEAGVRHSMTFFDAPDVESTFVATTRAFANLHFDLDRFQPFVGANVGIRYGDDEIDETGTLAPELGIKLFAFENAFILAMGEYQWFFNEVGDLDDTADDGQFVYTLGLGFTF